MEILTIAFISILLGYIKYRSIAFQYKDKSCELKFIELWNNVINFFIAGLIGYYFVTVRWFFLKEGSTISVGDILLLLVFILGIFGHLCVMSHNLTESIKDIVQKYIGKL